MKQLLSSSLVRQSLAGHSWLGLLLGALMYLLCLSGTLAVFYLEYERWEQPHVEEVPNPEPAAVERAFNRFLHNDDVELTEHMYVVLPTEASPRVSVSSELEGRYVRADGSLGERVEHEWTHLLTYLHLYLHLPPSWGMIVVSAVGALLVGLIITGFLAHPRVFRDAFSLRLNGSGRLKQVDIHNRLSVWGAPFHLMIGVTGAYFGLVLLLLAVIAAATGRSPSDVEGVVFGEEPALEQEVEDVAVGRALENLAEIAPEAHPLLVTLHQAGTPEQFLEVYGQHEGRLIYGESYRFDAEGEFLGQVGFSNGDVGKQAVYSIYRLHFGHFGGFWVKVLYTVLGLALTVVSVTGVNIWLARRKGTDFVNYVWPGFVWGAPAGLAVSAFTQVILGVPSTAIFWAVTAAGAGYGLLSRDETRTRRHVQLLCVAAVALLLGGYVVKHGTLAFTPAAVGVNAALLATGSVLAWLARRQRTGQGGVSRVEGQMATEQRAL